MGFKWKDSVQGGINGFRAGSRFGPYGMIIGAVGGAAAGGYAKNINKKFTGNSQSGTTEGLIETAGDIGSSGSATSKGAGVAGNLFSRANSKPEKGYENNPAVLQRQKDAQNDENGSGLDISKLLSQASGSGQGAQSGGMGRNPMDILGGKKEDNQQTDIDAILKMIMAQQSQPSLTFKPNSYQG